MPRRRPLRVVSTVESRATQIRKPSGKELDLVLLAGCSCLMTILYHPVADALQASPTAARSVNTDVAAQVSRTQSTWSTAIQMTLPAKREKIVEEESEED